MQASNLEALPLASLLLLRKAIYLCIVPSKHAKSLQMVPVLSYLIFKIHCLCSPRGRRNHQRCWEQPPCMRFLGAVMLGVTVNVCHVFHNENHVRACFCPILVTCSNSWGSLTEQKHNSELGVGCCGSCCAWERRGESSPRPPDPVPIAQPPGPAGGRDLTAKVGVQCGYRESPGDAAQEEWELRARKCSPWLS